MTKIKIRPIFNKKNKQINFSIPKKKVPIKIRKKLKDLKSLEFKVQKWEFGDG